MPYASQAQQRFFHAAGARGEIPEKTVKEFDQATDFSHLPEKVGQKSPNKARALRARAMRMK